MEDKSIMGLEQGWELKMGLKLCAVRRLGISVDEAQDG